MPLNLRGSAIKGFVGTKVLAQLVNAVGGITVTNNCAFNQGGHSFGTGELQLNGEEALA